MRRRVGRPGLLGTMARTAVISGTATAVSGGVRRRTAPGPAAPAASPPPAPPSQPVAPAAPSQPDRLAQLRELGELRQAGVLTEAEFAAEKARILAG